MFPPALALFTKALCVAIALFLLLSLARGLVWAIHMFLIAPRFDVLRHLPGPTKGALENHFREVMDPSISPKTHHDWVKTYGKTFRFHGFGSHDYRLLSLDFRVISHVLNSPIYEKPWQSRSLLSRLLGRGVFAMEGAEHKAQRRLIGPAFTTQAVKSMTPIFFQKSEELRDCWETLIAETPNNAPPSKVDTISASSQATDSTTTVINISHWISRATLDVIGLAGFDYQFNSLQNETEGVYLAYRKMFNAADKGPGFTGLLQLYFPILEKLFPDESTKVINESRRVIQDTGKKVVASKKAAILAEKSCASEIREKDILSLLIKSNLSSDPSKRLSDDELLDQLSTFLFAGSDSTGLGISWCLHLLSLHPDIQTRLRQELLSFSLITPTSRPVSSCSRPDSSDSEDCNPYPTPPSSTTSSPTSYSFQAHADAIDGLTLLDSVVRETLRLCPPVHGTIRVATATDSIPVSSPVTMRDGSVVQPGESITIGKGSYVHIPIEGLNMSEDIWGEDAEVFNPDRWSSLPKSARPPNHPGIANLMTFSFGPHSCPGAKFSIFEMKIFLATLLPEFTFEPAEDIRKYNAILTRPYVYDTFELGTRLPLKVGRYCH